MAIEAGGSAGVRKKCPRGRGRVDILQRRIMHHTTLTDIPPRPSHRIREVSNLPHLTPVHVSPHSLLTKHILHTPRIHRKSPNRNIRPRLNRNLAHAPQNTHLLSPNPNRPHAPPIFLLPPFPPPLPPMIPSKPFLLTSIRIPSIHLLLSPRKITHIRRNAVQHYRLAVDDNDSRAPRHVERGRV